MMQSQQIPMTFQRYETKYMLSPIMARKLARAFRVICRWMNTALIPSAASITIPRITSSSAVRWKNPSTKKKLRLRSYGPARDQPHIRRTKEKNMKESSTNAASA